MTHLLNATLIESIQVVEATYLLKFKVDALPAFAPGQFLQLQCAPPTVTATGFDSGWRPFGILAANPAESQYHLLVRDRGKGTQQLTHYKPGTELLAYGACGSGFSLPVAFPASQKVLLIAEGISVVLVVELAKQLIAQGVSVTLLAANPKYPAIPAATLLGEVADQIDYRPLEGITIHQIFAGQVNFSEYSTMYLSLAPRSYPELINAGLLGGKGILANPQVYFQKTLPCGIGACGKCTITTLAGEQLVCQQGPVFELGQVKWRV